MGYVYSIAPDPDGLGRDANNADVKLADVTKVQLSSNAPLTAGTKQVVLRAENLTTGKLGYHYLSFEVTVDPALTCWSSDFSGGALDAVFDTVVNTATTVTFTGSSIAITVATGEEYSIYETLINIPDGQTWKIIGTFTNISLSGSSDTFDFGVRGKIGSNYYQAMLHQSAVNTRGFYALKSSTFTLLQADSSNSHSSIDLSVEYNGSDTITCSDGTNTKTYSDSGDMTNVRMAVSQNPTGDTISGNFSNLAVESPIGTPYCSL